MDLIVWSGGFDSTAIVLEYIRQQKEFQTVYIQIDNNKDKMMFEESRRNTIRSLLPLEFRDKLIPSLTYLDVDRHIIHQSFHWLNMLFYGISTCDCFDNIAFGYVRGDDFWHKRHDFEKTFEHIWNLCCKDNCMKQPNLIYPLEWLNKEDILTKCYLNDSMGREIFEYTWTCEIPQLKDGIYESCNECNSCNNFKKIKDLYDEKFKAKLPQTKSNK